MDERIIAHLDMDAFFAAIEERDNPLLAGKPIVVGADPLGGKGRGVVSTANYKAREYGIRSALPISKAWQFAEAGRKKGMGQVYFVSGSYGKYSETSRRIMALLEKATKIVEQASVDEAYLDLSSAKTFKKAEEICWDLKEQIWQKERLTASIGLAQNKLVAKISSDFEKPDGLTVVLPEKVIEFLAPLSIRKIPGIGPKTEIILARKKVRTVGDAQKLSWNELERMFGKWGFEMYERVRGIDDSPVVYWDEDPKSIGKHETFGEDTRDLALFMETLGWMAEEVIARMKRQSLSGFRTIVLTVRFDDFVTKNRSHSYKIVQNSASFLEKEATKMLMPFLDARENPAGKSIRLIGLRIEKLDN